MAATGVRLLKPPSVDELARLIAVARGQAPADLLFVGGRVVNVYSGEVLPANVAVVGGRIAYVGPSERPAGGETRVVELGGRVLAPGYLEPHCHPYMLYNPLEFCRTVLARGTTTVVADDIFIFQVLEQADFEALQRDLSGLPLRILWGIRLATERTRPDGGAEFFPLERILRSLELPGVVQTGEMTSWPALLAGDSDHLQAVARARALGLRLDGHAPGCSYETLAALAAAGISACHESISAQEVVSRVRLGLHAMLRYQSLRPDLRELLRGLRDQPLARARLMLTTDGSSPAYYADGYTDRLIRIAIEEGMEPVAAYQLATLHPATYFGLEQDLGGIAPGRLADLVVLREIGEPEPEQVYSEGRLVARDGALVDELPRLDWERYRFQAPQAPDGWLLEPDRLRAPHCGGPFPVMRLDNAAISRRVNRELPSSGGRVLLAESSGLLYAALVDRGAGDAVGRPRWISQGVIEGFAREVDGFASSFTATLDVLAFGRDTRSMARAVEQVFTQGGGIALVEQGQVQYTLPLDIGGVMSSLPMPRLIERIRELERLLVERGYPYHDPVYTLMFLSSDALPDLRLTPAGLFQVKSRQVLKPPESL